MNKALNNWVEKITEKQSIYRKQTMMDERMKKEAKNNNLKYQKRSFII
jgi:hypothetical protein